MASNEHLECSQRPGPDGTVIYTQHSKRCLKRLGVQKESVDIDRVIRDARLFIDGYDHYEHCPAYKDFNNMSICKCWQKVMFNTVKALEEAAKPLLENQIFREAVQKTAAVIRDNQRLKQELKYSDDSVMFEHHTYEVALRLIAEGKSENPADTAQFTLKLCGKQ